MQESLAATMQHLKHLRGFVSHCPHSHLHVVRTKQQYLRSPVLHQVGHPVVVSADLPCGFSLIPVNAGQKLAKGPATIARLATSTAFLSKEWLLLILR